MNAFPDAKMLRRGGQTRLDWLKPDDQRRESYSLDNVFLLDHTGHVRAKGQMWRIKWAVELADNLRRFMLDGRNMFHWLSTWQPWTETLDGKLGFTLDEEPSIHGHEGRTGLWQGVGLTRVLVSQLTFTAERETN